MRAAWKSNPFEAKALSACSERCYSESPWFSWPFSTSDILHESGAAEVTTCYCRVYPYSLFFSLVENLVQCVLIIIIPSPKSFQMYLLFPIQPTFCSCCFRNQSSPICANNVLLVVWPLQRIMQRARTRDYTCS